MYGPRFYYHLVADNLTENGYFSGLNSGQCILGTLTTNNNFGIMASGEGSHIIVKNMRQKRRIRFRLYGPDMKPIPSTETPIGNYWTCTLLFTPILI